LDILSNASTFVKKEFGIELDKTRLTQYDALNWIEFCNANSFDASSEGLYVPSAYAAYVNSDSSVLVSNVFHEYFGHGLFCEHSKIGKDLVARTQKNEDVSSLLHGRVDEQQLFGLARQNIWNYEGFAVWLEHLLCKETGNSSIWQKRAASLPPNQIAVLEHFIDAEHKMTRFGFMSQLGFPKFYTNDAVLGSVRKLYGNAFDNIDYVVLYGSRKPESDIDLFIISSNPSRNYFNGWIDIYELNKEEFLLHCSNLDISVTDPLFSGELIHGDRYSFDKVKESLEKFPILSQAISHNQMRAEEHSKDLLRFDDERLRKNCESYIRSFSLNAELLSLGFKGMTLKGLEKSLS
jgi:predicted nucleotidyltransferase